MQGQKVSGHQIGPTQPDWTLFFTYLLLVSFRNCGSNAAIYNFFKAWNQWRWVQTLFLIIWKKVVVGATTQKYKKQTQKTWFWNYGHAPRSARCVKRNGRKKGSITLCVLALIFSPNWTNFEKLSQNSLFWYIFMILWGFLKFVQFRLVPCAFPVLLTPLTPLAPLGARPYLNRNCVRFGCVPHRKCTAAPSVVYDPARASKTKESKAHWC